jgi:hypothetical protein
MAERRTVAVYNERPNHDMKRTKVGLGENQKLIGNAMDCSVKMGKVRIADELGGKLRPSEKGNSFSTAIKYKLI